MRAKIFSFISKKEVNTVRRKDKTEKHEKMRFFPLSFQTFYVLCVLSENGGSNTKKNCNIRDKMRVRRKMCKCGDEDGDHKTAKSMKMKLIFCCLLIFFFLIMHLDVACVSFISFLRVREIKRERDCV